MKPKESLASVWECLEEWQPWVMEGSYSLHNLGLTDADDGLAEGDIGRIKRVRPA